MNTSKNIKGTIKMPKEYWSTLNTSLKVAEYFWNLDFTNAFKCLFENGFLKDNDICNVEKEAEEVKKLLFDNRTDICKNIFIINRIKGYRKKFENQDDACEIMFNDLTDIAHHIDFVIRIWIGQWQELQQLACSCYDKAGNHFTAYAYMSPEIKAEIMKCRNRMLPAFAKNGIWGYSYFSIYSPALNNDVRILYGIYKALCFATTGDPYYRETVNNLDRIVSITFPYKEEYIVKNLPDTKKWLADHPLFFFAKERPSFLQDGKELFLVVNDNYLITVKEGDKIFVCQNNLLQIEKHTTVSQT